MNHDIKHLNVFIGSSAEAINIANGIFENLERHITPNPWYSDTFGINEYTMDSLEKELNNNDFAIFIFSPDDVAIIRDKTVFITRDNTIFEMGLFYGKLGKERVFAIVPNTIKHEIQVEDNKVISDFHILSDFSGITLAYYDNERKDNKFSSITLTACNKILNLMKIHDKYIDPETENKKLKHISEKNKKILHFFNTIHKYKKVKLSKKLLEERYIAIADNLSNAFQTPSELRTSGFSIWIKQKMSSRNTTESMVQQAGNVGVGKSISFEEKDRGVIIAYNNEKWCVFDEKDSALEGEHVLCYYLGNDTVVSLHFQFISEFKLDTSLYDYYNDIVQDNDSLFRSLKTIIGGGKN